MEQGFKDLLQSIFIDFDTIELIRGNEWFAFVSNNPLATSIGEEIFVNVYLGLRTYCLLNVTLSKMKC